MTPLDIVSAVRAAGGSIQAVDGALEVLDPAGVLEPATLDKHRAELVALLSPPADTFDGPDGHRWQFVDRQDGGRTFLRDDYPRDWQSLHEAWTDGRGDPVLSQHERRDSRNASAGRRRAWLKGRKQR